ncbi:MAG: replicative DNA helicase [Gammaproteobacteria bacterium]|nr:replicative DNA helicase [Gammaproteobacteria bacterium]
MSNEITLPPQSIDAEQSVLGGLILNNDAYDNIIEIISEIDFYKPEHRVIFHSIKTLIESDEPCDVITLTNRLNQDNNIDKAGGFSYIGDLASNTPSASNIKAYAAIVREFSVLRQMIMAGSEIANDGYHPEGRKSAELLEEAEKKVFNISEQSESSEAEFKLMPDLIRHNIDRIDKLYHSDKEHTGLPTGYTEIDKITSGLQPGDLIIVAGRPSMGKTTFAMNIAENIAINENSGVVIFSLEMPAESLTLRMFSSIGRINQSRVRSGKLSDDEMAGLTNAISILNKAKIYIDDTGTLSPNVMKARVRRLKRKHDISLIVVDYLQLMSIPGKGDNRVNEISEISRGLKLLAKEMNVPVIALSQLSRTVESRNDKRPIMSDLRESGAIEQDADLIMFVYRDEFYNKEDSKFKGMGEAIISKHRNGELGTIPLIFLGQYTRFENYASKEYYAE